MGTQYLAGSKAVVQFPETIREEYKRANGLEVILTMDSREIIKEITNGY